MPLHVQFGWLEGRILCYVCFPTIPLQEEKTGLAGAYTLQGAVELAE